MEDMRTRRYQIIISGRLGAVCCEAFPDFHIAPHGADTALTGDLTRSGLHDALTRIRDLALDLVGITCLAPELARVPGASGPRGAFTEPGPGNRSRAGAPLLRCARPQATRGHPGNCHPPDAGVTPRSIISAGLGLPL